MKRVLVLSAFALACAQPAQEVEMGTSAATTAAPAVRPENLARHVETLASDAFLGRGPATAGEDSTVRYISRQMQAAGLEPGGPNGSWFQEVPLLQSEIVGTPKLALNVGGRRMDLTQGEQVAIRSSMQKADRVVVQAPLVFVGYAVNAPERNWNDFAGGELRGKIGVALINDPDFETGQGDFGGKAMTYYGRWTYKYEEAARQGLAGLLIVHETAPASYGWATVKNALRTVDSQNVVAKLDGSDPTLKDEYVVYSAHWDHLGVGAPVNGDKIYNGALDNASGVATVLELAKAFTQIQPPPRRSILFLMVTAEEQGLLGSQYYATTPLYPLNKTVANINIDGVNQWGRAKDFTVIGMGASDLDDYLKAAADEQGRILRADPEPEKGFYYRSDHFNFAKQGVPALDPDAGIDYIGKDPAYGEAKRDEYTEKDYHAPSDEIKPDWDLSGAVEDGQLLFAVGYRVANADKFPEWKAGNEFKATREASLKK